MPSLFSTRDLSKPAIGPHGEHIGGLGNPADREIKRFKRLVDGYHQHSEERLVSTTTAARVSRSISQEIPLEDIHVRNDVDVHVDQGSRHCEINSASIV